MTHDVRDIDRLTCVRLDLTAGKREQYEADQADCDDGHRLRDARTSLSGFRLADFLRREASEACIVPPIPKDQIPVPETITRKVWAEEPQHI